MFASHKWNYDCRKLFLNTMKELKQNIEDYKKELLLRSKLDTELYLHKLFKILPVEYEKFRVQKRPNH